ncbi:CelD/BcsL family acetyltransferase involved in cellulose biosynthesis [Massilia aurea]|uniref:CelD/BcsL family acetyltransferase involved in cellulose biosynthesis n=1 Tax=Massilia aurea TaxID=373040 RepID=A0A7W9X0M4_9BURK|nr:GNAT family N-acetyltransferase [Massilia aurea]MBB6134298.1 CelD/BcsL family acetyltransferase involved in cellulose biosynthesis [Massilia aurea]
MSWTVVAARELAAPEMAARWRQVHRAGPASPLLALEFVNAALAVYGSGRERLAWHTHNGQIDTIAILTPGQAGVWHTFQPAQAPLGFWLQRGDLGPPAGLAPLLRALPGPALMLGLSQCDPLLMPRPDDSPALRGLDYIETAHVNVTGSFDDYWQARGKNLRSNLRKQRKRLADDGIVTRLQLSTTVAEMATAVEDYGRLESTGWKGADGTAVASGNAQGRFYRTLLEAFAANGGARVYRYWIGEQLAAMDLCIEGSTFLVVLKTAYDEHLDLPAASAGQLSPALLMREEAVRDIFDAGQVARIEFYGRVMEWHRRWSDDFRVLYHLNAYRWSWLGRLHARIRGT